MRFARFIPFLFLFSCLDGPDCLVTTTNLVKIDFKNVDGTAKTLALTNVTVSGTALTFYANQNVASVQLPVNPTATETTFTFVEGATSKSIKIGYAVTNRVISEKCGAFAYYTDLRILENEFTSARVRNFLLLTNVTSNVEIFY